MLPPPGGSLPCIAVCHQLLFQGEEYYLEEQLNFGDSETQLDQVGKGKQEKPTWNSMALYLIP